MLIKKNELLKEICVKNNILLYIRTQPSSPEEANIEPITFQVTRHTVE